MITNKTRASFPRLPVLEIKNEILGEDYDLSLACVSARESSALNKKYRGKDNPTNILSFPFDRQHGEIILCPEVIRREAETKKFGRAYRELMGFLVIHGMLHLKGARHSSKMERVEEKYDKKYFSRDRRRVVRGPRRGGRIHKRRSES